MSFTTPLLPPRRREVEAALAARGIRPGDVADFAASAQRNAIEREAADAEKVRQAAMQVLEMDIAGRAPQHPPPLPLGVPPPL